MKRNDTALYIFVGLLALGVFSFFFKVKSSVIASISIAMLLFSIAQVIEAVISYDEENKKLSLESYKTINGIELTDGQLLFMKSFISNFDPNKKKCALKLISTILHCVAFAILFIGFVAPLDISDSISAAITIISAAMIFLSMWLTERNIRKAGLWEEVQKLSLLQYDRNITQNQPSNTDIIEGKNESEEAAINGSQK